MATTIPTAPSGTAQIDPMRRTSRAAGILYLSTFVSVPTLMVFQPVRDGAEFVLGTGSATAVLWGSFSEVVVAVTEGRMDLGPWEQIFYGEFDGRRAKRVLVKIIGE